MTLKQFVVGLQSLRAVTPGLILIAAALLLVLLPKRWSAIIGGAVLLSAVFGCLIAVIAGPNIALPDRTDLTTDSFSKCAPVWFIVVLPVLSASLQGRALPTRGLANAGLLFTAGSLCFAAASRTASLLYVSTDLAFAGVAGFALSCSDSEIRTQRFAARSVVAVLFLSCLLTVGFSLGIPGWGGDLASIHPIPVTPSRAIGSLLLGIVVVSLLGAAPVASWQLGWSPGVQSGASVLCLLIGSVLYVKLAAAIRLPEASMVLWAWAAASGVFHFIQLLRSPELSSIATNFLAVVASVATSLLVLADARAAPGAAILLVSLTIAGPVAALAIEAGELSVSGALGRPQGARLFALQMSLFVTLGLPLSLAFWGWRFVILAAAAPGSMAGARQVAAAMGVFAILVVAFKSLSALVSLRACPPLPPLDEDRWFLTGSLVGGFVLLVTGLWPAPIFAAVTEVLATAGVK